MPRVWGGDERIRAFFSESIWSKSVPASCGECWLVSAVPEHPSVVAEGPFVGKSLKSLLSKYKGRLLGKAAYQKYGDDFPLLVKLIDSVQPLSIQVHPNDVQAKVKHQCRGKTEVWYILDAEPGAEVISGFNQVVTASAFRDALKRNKFSSLLNRVSARKGDVFFIPARRIHNTGKGVFMAEVQETSDITYRIHDFDRQRPLHVEEALEVLDFSDTGGGKSKIENDLLVHCEHFMVRRLFPSGICSLDSHDQRNGFSLYLCLAGEGRLLSATGRSYSMTSGVCYLLPAEHKGAQLSARTSDWMLLEIAVP